MAHKNSFPQTQRSLFATLNPLVSSRTAVVILISILEFSTVAQAQSPTCSPSSHPVALVMSGGTSLGSYQAGAIHRILQAIQQHKEKYQLKMLAGASAGGINGLLAFQDHCSLGEKTNPTPWLFRFWQGINAKELFHPQGHPNSLLNRQATEKISESFFQDWENSAHVCDLILSTPLTLKEPRILPFAGTQKSRSQFLTFSLRAKPSASRSEHVLQNYGNPGAEFQSSLLDFSQEKQVRVLNRLAQATSSIPVIFPPVEVPFCQPNLDNALLFQKQTPPFQCPPELVRNDAFIDGALLDQTPMAASLKLLRNGLQFNCENRSWEWSERPQNHIAAHIPRQLLIINLDVHNLEPTNSLPPSETRLTQDIPSLLSNLLQSARDRELLRELEEDPQSQHQILSLRSFLPRWSDEWNGFFGFLDKDLRAFDYWVGYVDMDETLKRDYPDLNPPSKAENPPLPALVHCLREFIHDKPSSLQTCEKITATEKKLLSAILSSPPLPQQSSFLPRMQSLVQQKFEFDELELSAAQTDRAPTRVRSWLSESARSLSDAFPGDSSTTLDTVTSFLFGLNESIPREDQFHFAAGSSSEIGYSRLFWSDYASASYWRWPLVVSLYAPRLLATSSEETAGINLLSGIEIQKPLSTSVDLLFSLRGGYQWTHTRLDKASAAQACQSGQLDHCEGYVLNPMVNVIFLSTLRMEIGALINWDRSDRKNVNSAALFLGGLQF